jgi:hypothetical protein
MKLGEMRVNNYAYNYILKSSTEDRHKAEIYMLQPFSKIILLDTSQ